MTFLVPLLLSAGFVPDVAPPPVGDCHSIESGTVLARDVAPFIPDFARLPDDFLIGYVEPSGAPKLFRAADLERIAKNRGIEPATLEDLCLKRRTFVVPVPGMIDAIRKTVADAESKIEILSSSQQPVPTGEIVFPRSGVQPPIAPDVMWRGYVQAEKGTKYPIWAKVRVTVTANRIIATSDLQISKLIQPDQVRVESTEVSPFEDSFAGAASDVLGLVAKATIQKGSAIRKSQVMAPLDVARGDTVRVDVFTSNAHLSVEARAETSGMKGSTITVRNLVSGRDFQAKITGKDQVTVGGQAE